MKLELGSGHRPTPGYIHNDLQAFEGVDLTGPAHLIALPDDSLDEVLALGVIEHLTYTEARAAFVNVHRMLREGGEFVFDVPDLEVWAQYLSMALSGEPTPLDLNHILHTIYGWQRWVGDEHRWGWTRDSLHEALDAAGFRRFEPGVEAMRRRGHHRPRFDNPDDAHIYMVAG